MCSRVFFCAFCGFFTAILVFILDSVIRFFASFLDIGCAFCGFFTTTLALILDSVTRFFACNLDLVYYEMDQPSCSWHTTAGSHGKWNKITWNFEISVAIK